MVGSKSIQEKDIYGTWKYKGSDCVFESDNILKQAGGALASHTLEDQLNGQLAKVGIKPGSCSFTFNEDKTFNANLAGHNVNGTYTFDAKKKTIKFSSLLGLGNVTTHVAKTNGKLSLLFDSDKLLKLAAVVGKASGDATLSTLSKLAESYKGMKVGLQMEK